MRKSQYTILLHYRYHLDQNKNGKLQEGTVKKKFTIENKMKDCKNLYKMTKHFRVSYLSGPNFLTIGCHMCARISRKTNYTVILVILTIETGLN